MKRLLSLGALGFLLLMVTAANATPMVEIADFTGPGSLTVSDLTTTFLFTPTGDVALQVSGGVPTTVLGTDTHSATYSYTIQAAPGSRILGEASQQIGDADFGSTSTGCETVGSNSFCWANSGFAIQFYDLTGVGTAAPIDVVVQVTLAANGQFATYNGFTHTYALAEVPEPATLFLLGSGLTAASAAVARGRRSRVAARAREV